MRISKVNEVTLATTNLVYGGVGVGKTYSVNSVPGNVLFLNFEQKRPLLNNPRGNITIMDVDEGDRFDDWMDYLRIELDALDKDLEGGVKRWDNLFIDSMSFCQTELRRKLEDSHYAVLLENREVKRVKIDETAKYRMTFDEWGAIGSMMDRFTRLANAFTKRGVNVIVTYHLDEFNNVFQPKVQGKAFSPAPYFDNVGMLIPQKNTEGKITFPTLVQFWSDGACLARCKYSQIYQNELLLPLDWEFILSTWEKFHRGTAVVQQQEERRERQKEGGESSERESLEKAEKESVLRSKFKGVLRNKSKKEVYHEI